MNQQPEKNKSVTDKIKVLLIEDNPDDAVIIKRMLSKVQTPAIELEWADRFSKGMELLKSEDFDIVERVEEIATEKEVKPAQIALAFLFNKKYITSPIVGVTRVEYIEDAVEALEIKLTPDEMKRLEELYKPHRIIGHPE